MALRFVVTVWLAGGEGGVPLRGVVHTGRIHRDQPGDRQPGRGAFLQQTGHGGAVDQRRHAGGEDDAAGRHRFPSNEVRLWLSEIACNLGNLSRRLVLPTRIDKWALTSFEQWLVKTSGRLIKHARYFWLLLAEGHLTLLLF